MPDVARDPAILKRKRLRQVILAVLAGIVVVVVSVALARMEPAAPTVERATVLEDVVKRGSIIRQVRGPGTLVPEGHAVAAGHDRRPRRTHPAAAGRARRGRLGDPRAEQPAGRAGGARRAAGAAVGAGGARQPARPAAKRAPDPGGRHGGARLRGAAGQDGGRRERAAGQSRQLVSRADPAAVAAASGHAEAARGDRGQAPGRGRGRHRGAASACSKPRWTRRGRYPACATSGCRC